MKRRTRQILKISHKKYVFAMVLFLFLLYLYFVACKDYWVSNILPNVVVQANNDND